MDALHTMLQSTSHHWVDSALVGGKAGLQRRLLSGLSIAAGAGSLLHAEVAIRGQAWTVVAVTDRLVIEAIAVGFEPPTVTTWALRRLASIELIDPPNLTGTSDDLKFSRVELHTAEGHTVTLGGQDQTELGRQSMLGAYPKLIDALA